MKYDDILNHLGEFGWYQKRLYFIVCLPTLTAAMNALLTVFTLNIPLHRCAIPGWDNDTYAIQNLAHEWMIYRTIPPGTGQEKTLYTNCRHYDQSSWTNWTRPENFTEENWPSRENLTQVGCDRWVFDKTIFQTTVTEEMSLVCSQLIKRSHINMFTQVGIMIGSVTLGILADILGRKKVLCSSLALVMAVGIGTFWIPEYISLCFSRVLLGIFGTGYFLNAFTIGIELVGPSMRMWTGMFIEIFWVFGEALLALLAYFIRDWRYLQLAISIPSVFYLGYWWFIPESPRWLLANGKLEDYEKIIQRAAEVNNVTLPDNVFDKMEEEPSDQPQVKLWQMFSHRTLLIRSLIIFFNWAVSSMVYYGLSLNSGYLYGGVHLNFFLSVVVEAIGYGMCFPLLNRIGRKAVQAGSMIIGGIACCCTIFTVLYLPDEYQPVTTALALLGKLGASAAFAVIYIYSSELFPTVVRNGSMGISSMSARVGSMSAPYIADLGTLIGGSFGTALPLLVFGGTSVAAGIAALWLPETLNRKLPETIEDAINFGKSDTLNPSKQVEDKYTPKVDYDNQALELKEF